MCISKSMTLHIQYVCCTGHPVQVPAFQQHSSCLTAALQIHISSRRLYEWPRLPHITSQLSTGSDCRLHFWPWHLRQLPPLPSLPSGHAELHGQWGAGHLPVWHNGGVWDTSRHRTLDGTRGGLPCSQARDRAAGAGGTSHVGAGGCWEIPHKSAVCPHTRSPPEGAAGSRGGHVISFTFLFTFIFCKFGPMLFITLCVRAIGLSWCGAR